MAVTSSSPADSFSRNAGGSGAQACVAISPSLCIVSTTTLLSMRSAFNRASTSSPREARHRQVGHDHVRPEPAGRFDERLAVPDGADHVEVVLLEQA